MLVLKHDARHSSVGMLSNQNKVILMFQKKKLRHFFFQKTVVSLTTKRKMSEDEEIALSQNHATIIKQNTPRELQTSKGLKNPRKVISLFLLVIIGLFSLIEMIISKIDSDYINNYLNHTISGD